MTDQQPYEPPQPANPQPVNPPPVNPPPVNPPQTAVPQPGAPAAPVQPAYPAPQQAYPGAQPTYPAQPGNQGYPAPGYGAPAYGAPGYGAPVQQAVPLGASSPEDLTLPLYGATFGQAISRFFKKYATFSGRASRSEYWWVQLFLGLVGIVGFVLFAVVGGIGAAQASGSGDATGLVVISGIVGVVLLIFGLAVLVPSIAIAWRRLHDANFAGPFWFLTFTYIGGLVVLVFTILPSNALGQRFDRR